jgi:hypothetical protein
LVSARSVRRAARSRTHPTTYPALRELASRLGEDDDLLVGHEVGSQVYLVQGAVSAAGVTIQAFNAAHLRMIAASRKKTDRHDAYWIVELERGTFTPSVITLRTVAYGRRTRACVPASARDRSAG